MKKTINASLAGLSFVFDEDAYAALEAYMRSVRAHFASYKEADEIVNDIEARFAEQFAEKAGTGRVVILSEIEGVIASMGRPEQFESADTHAGQSATNNQSERRLYRDTQDMVLGGVASGIAAYLGYDPLWVRLAFFASIFFGGFGIFIYIVLWIVLPEAKTDAERMQMRGEPITLKNFEQMMKDRSNLGAAAQKPLGVIASLFRVGGKIIKKLFKLLIRIVGVALTAAAGIASAMFLFAAATLLLNGNSPYIDFPLQGLAHNVTYYTALLSGVVVVTIPLIILGLLGASILSGRSAFKRMAGYSLAGIWIVAGIVFANAAIRIAPQVEATLQANPAFQTSTQTLQVSTFNKIKLSGADTATVMPSSTISVTVEGREQDIQNAEVRVEQGVFSVHHNDPRKICLFCFHKPLHFTIYAPAIDAVDMSGATDATMAGFSMDTFSAKLSGASHLEFTGNASSSMFDLSGASNIDASEATLDKVKADLSGVSTLFLGNVGDLSVDASGASNVFYGTAKTFKEELSGASATESGWNSEE